MKELTLDKALNTPNIKFRANYKQIQEIINRTPSWTCNNILVIGFIMRNDCSVKPIYYMEENSYNNSPLEEIKIVEEEVVERRKSRRPVHPGEIIRVDYFYNSGKSLEEFSKDIGIKQERLIKIMEGEKNLKLKDSYKLAEAFNTTVELWIGLQKEYSSHKETEYLLSSTNNAKHLMESIEQLKDIK